MHHGTFVCSITAIITSSLKKLSHLLLIGYSWLNITMTQCSASMDRSEDMCLVICAYFNVNYLHITLHGQTTIKSPWESFTSLFVMRMQAVFYAYIYTTEGLCKSICVSLRITTIVRKLFKCLSHFSYFDPMLSDLLLTVLHTIECSRILCNSSLLQKKIHVYTIHSRLAYV